MEKILEQSLAENKIAGAYLLVGSRGSVELEASAFILRVMCDKGTACGICPGCKKVLAGVHSDVFTIERQPSKAHILVSDIEFITGEANQISYEGGKKIFFIKEADLLVEQAQNKLLKIIEEPPQNTVFLLGVDNIRNILPTILSRCIIVRVTGTDISAVVRRLVSEKNISAGAADVLARTANGDYFSACGFYEEGFIQIRDDMSEVVRRLLTQKNKGTSLMMAKLMQYEKKPDMVFLALSQLLKDCMELSMDNPSAVCNRDKLNDLAEWAQFAGTSRICITLDTILESEARKKQSTGITVRLLYEGMLLKILEKTV